MRYPARYLLTALLLTAGTTAHGQQEAATRPRAATHVATAPRLFEFHSNLWINLHHFLYVRARGLQGRDTTRATVRAALGDTAGFLARPETERRGWEAALDAAAPLYRAGWWSRHDATNRAWVDSTLPLLERHGATIASATARALGQGWPGSPIRVDVAPYTNWAGAYATERPSHIMISSLDAGYRGTLGLEMLFHEASHTLEDSLASAQRIVAGESGKTVPYNVLHAIICYSAGEVTRRTVPGHVPYIEAQGLARRGSMARYFPILERHWNARLDGSSTLTEAMRAIVGEL